MAHPTPHLHQKPPRWSRARPSGPGARWSRHRLGTKDLVILLTSNKACAQLQLRRADQVRMACPFCQRLIHPLKDGTLRHHNLYGPRVNSPVCPGVGLRVLICYVRGCEQLVRYMVEDKPGRRWSVCQGHLPELLAKLQAPNDCLMLVS